METRRAITIAILAMGGEGGGVLADWIIDLAEHCGYDAQATSVPGVAQRTGATIYYLEIFPRVEGKLSVLALMPVPGEVDVVIASELMEAGRAVVRGLVTADRTTLIASTHRVYSMIEKTAMGDGRASSEKLLASCEAAAHRFVHADFAAIAEENRSVISAALFGALASATILPFAREEFEAAIERGGVGVETSLAAFAAGFSAQRKPEEARPLNRTRSSLQSLAARIANDFPAEARDTLLAGVERLADFQDHRYAAEYLDRLAPVGDGALLRETARYLALWMSYEDAIRVADLKIRRVRFETIHKEVRVAPGQLLRVREFLHPRAQEIADILPLWFAAAILRSRVIDRMTRKGRVLETTSIRGFLQLYLLANLRRLRRRSLRFAREQEKITHWLTLVRELANEDPALAFEAAQCPRLLKGYGDTHQLGERNFDAILAAIRELRGKPGAALRARELREAALADENGAKLSAMLAEATK